jgi:hypothetical protein
MAASLKLHKEMDMSVEEPQGTFACPICGRSTPHVHSVEEQVEQRNVQKKIPCFTEVIYRDILDKAGLRYQLGDRELRKALIAGLHYGFDQGRHPEKFQKGNK